MEATDLELMNGQQYYTVVRCENNVGLTTERVSSPVVVDNTPPSKVWNVTLSHGVRYYVTVEATNGAGMTSHGWSSGFTVDVTPPKITEVNKTQKYIFTTYRGKTNRRYLKQ